MLQRSKSIRQINHMLETAVSARKEVPETRDSRSIREHPEAADRTDRADGGTERRKKHDVAARRKTYHFGTGTAASRSENSEIGLRGRAVFYRLFSEREERHPVLFRHRGAAVHAALSWKDAGSGKTAYRRNADGSILGTDRYSDGIVWF